MKQISLVITLAILGSCTSQDYLHDSRKRDSYKIHEASWQFNFKNQVFIACLHKLYLPNIWLMVDSIDGTKAAIYDRLDYNKQVMSIADSLATAISQKIDHSSPIEDRKVILNACLDYRTSKELDRFTDSLFKVINRKTLHEDKNK
ncbi:MAG TPA: hypothetical protein VG842_10065 [Sediminibacterium sp.]|nr:hypothetical protein [Sediminibacterium sp.]